MIMVGLGHIDLVIVTVRAEELDEYVLERIVNRRQNRTIALAADLR
jgi:hypothetical protein